MCEAEAFVAVLSCTDVLSACPARVKFCTVHLRICLWAVPALCREFTEIALSLSLALLNAGLDLVSFSGILFSIYPPLFVALLLYSITGTALTVYIGKVGAEQENKERLALLVSVFYYVSVQAVNSLTCM